MDKEEEVANEIIDLMHKAQQYGVSEEELIKSIIDLLRGKYVKWKLTYYTKTTNLLFLNLSKMFTYLH